ncbi:hypothetical protein E5S67_06352 [Microcoleus sp. IPMA8]|uniref:Uncharacterized protein n=1 Tax=Microcoleus asticus IPMA8 TaxID=2563858 RepID=A0ABX2D9A8_9CYAN|nr:hypothetical protein [Microcoleus asticus IPMA8]
MVNSCSAPSRASSIETTWGKLVQQAIATATKATNKSSASKRLEPTLELAFNLIPEPQPIATALQTSKIRITT